MSTMEYGSWHPENWDAITLAWLKSPEGSGDLALVKAAPKLLEACRAAEKWISDVAKHNPERFLNPELDEMERVGLLLEAALKESTEQTTS